METYHLPVAVRTATGKKTAALRTEGMLPGVVYGHGTENVNISVAYIPFEKIYKTAGENSLVDLVIDGKPPVKVLIHDIQRDALSYRYSHVDFYTVRMNEKLTTNIPLDFIGESKAIEEQSGILVKTMEEVEVRCLPNDLVHDIKVDISKLATFEDQITIADLIVPKGMEIMHEPDEVVATVDEPISEAELAALDEKVEENVEAVEVEKKGKEEEGE